MSERSLGIDSRTDSTEAGEVKNTNVGMRRSAATSNMVVQKKSVMKAETGEEEWTSDLRALSTDPFDFSKSFDKRVSILMCSAPSISTWGNWTKVISRREDRMRCA